jgi:hypothetical protein
LVSIVVANGIVLLLVLPAMFAVFARPELEVSE